MEEIFSFQLTALDPGRLCAQVSLALEKRTETVSRQKNPKMWRNWRGVLGILNLLMGGLLCWGGLMNVQQLGGLLVLGAAGVVIGFARKLLDERAGRTGMEKVRVTFSDQGMTVAQEGEEGSVVGWDSFEMVLETEDLLLPVFQEAVIILQKSDLLTGTISGLRALLEQKVPYVQTK